MKIVYLISGIIVTLATLMIIILNMDAMTKISILNGTAISLQTGIIILLGSLLGIIGTSLFWTYMYEANKAKQYKHIRVAEKASIKAEESSDRVKVLEAKIKTLEEALKKALKDSKSN